MPLHPQAQQFVDDLAAQKGPSWEELGPEEGRRLFASLTDLFGEGPEVAEVEDRQLAGTVPVRIYKPDGAGPHPSLVYFHGGGWVLGNLDTHDTLCRRLCHESSAVIISVDYRRAPEHPFPAALDDCYAATQAAATDAESLGVDPHRLLVGGDSAGGSLALGVVRRAKAEGGPRIRAQVLIYPVVEPNFDTASYREFADGYGLTRDTMRWFWDQYRGDNEDDADPLLVPGPNADLSELPPAHVITAEYDVLRDEGENLAARLQAAGVPTRLRRYKGMIHGFVHFSGIFDIGKKAVSDVAGVIREAAGD